MECFQHQGRAAVGLCKSCYKALCRDCATPTPAGLACSEACATDVDEMGQVIERNKKLYGIGHRKSRVPATGVILWGAMAAILWILTLLSYSHEKGGDITTAILAVMFTLITGLAWYSVKRTGMQC